MFFKSKKPEPVKQDSKSSQDLAIITQMNQEFATSLDLTETLQKLPQMPPSTNAAR